jgi:hypothetical protein
MSRGPHRFKYSDAKRLVRSFGEATGAGPEDVILEHNLREGTLRVMTKPAAQENSQEQPDDEWKIPDGPQKEVHP